MIRELILNLAASFRLSIISKSHKSQCTWPGLSSRIWKLLLHMHLESLCYTVRLSLHPSQLTAVKRKRFPRLTTVLYTL